MKYIIMITQFVSMPGEKTNGRFRYLADEIIKEDVKLELITTNFSHRDKKHRVYDNNSKKCKYKYTMLNEPGYSKNISLKRIYSHFVFSQNLKKYLDKLNDKPDVIYCAVPSLDAAKQAAIFAKKNNIRFIIDIQDLWPEAFKMIFNVPILSNIIFYPMKKKADYVYKTADDIIAVSDTYANRAITVNKKYKNKIVAFLGTDLETFDSYSKERNISIENIKIVYVGTLGYSYDIKLIIDAIRILNNKGINNAEFILIGGGPLKNEFEVYSKEKKVNCKFLGRLPYNEMVKELCSCDIAVNPINKGSAGSILNKVGDYAAAGLPVINTQESEEYRELVEQYDIGFNCKNGDANNIADKMEILIKDRKLIEIKGKNNRKLAEEKFNRKKTYKYIIKDILGEY